MKAVPVLLCLALVHGITANIFKQHDRPVDGLAVQQQEYIDQYQRQHRNQPSVSEQQLQQQPRQHQKRDQLRDQQSDRVQQEQQPQSQEWDQRREQSLHSKPQQYQQYQQPAYQSVQYQPLSVQQSQEQYPVHNSHHRSQYKYKPRHSQSQSSSSSSESSQESHERQHYYGSQKSPSRTHSQQWDSTLQASVMNQDIQMAPAYAIQWQQEVDPKTAVQGKEEIEQIFANAQNAMRHITEEEKVKFHEAYELAKVQDNTDAELNATQLAQKYQYPVEEHTIKTDDGYVLTLFRIPPKKQIRDVQKRPVVFLMHGILGSADDWLLMGPQKSLAYLLSDAGYDVWLGNARGNKYSRRHVSKSPAMSDFWQYSTDEIALHDLPAMIDYALETTQQQKLYYIGHSLGTTAFFALTATRPEYNNKIVMMYALAPMVYMTNVRSPLFRMIAPTSKFHSRLQKQIGNSIFNPNKELIRAVGGDMLENEVGCKYVSLNVYFVMAGVNIDGLEAQSIPVVMNHLPAGTSTKVIKQYGQAVASNEFRRYDYGAKINQKVYGSEQAPKYNMQNVQAPVTLYYSEEDWLAHPKDVVRLEKELPNVRETNKVADAHFSNMDFQFSSKAPAMVYRHLIESMESQQNEQINQ